MTPRVVGLIVMLAIALVGVAPAMVCAMPAGCPMGPMASAPAHDCCATMAPCHPEALSAMTAPATTVMPSADPGTFVIAAAPASPASSTPVPLVVPPSPVPRFLLTHTFRL